MSSNQTMGGVSILSQAFNQVRPKLFYFLFAFCTAAGFLVVMLRILSFAESTIFSKLAIPFSDLTELIWTFLSFSILLGAFNFSKEWEQNKKTDVKKIFSVLFSANSLKRIGPSLFLISLIFFLSFFLKKTLLVFNEPNVISISFMVLEILLKFFLFFVAVRILDEDVSIGSSFKHIISKIKQNIVPICSLFIILGLIASIFFIFPVYFEKLTLSKGLIDLIGEKTIGIGLKLVGLFLLLQLIWLIPVFLYLPYNVYANLLKKD